MGAVPQPAPRGGTPWCVLRILAILHCRCCMCAYMNMMSVVKEKESNHKLLEK